MPASMPPSTQPSPYHAAQGIATIFIFALLLTAAIVAIQNKRNTHLAAYTALSGTFVQASKDTTGVAIEKDGMFVYQMRKEHGKATKYGCLFPHDGSPRALYEVAEKTRSGPMVYTHDLTRRLSPDLLKRCEHLRPLLPKR